MNFSQLMNLAGGHVEARIVQTAVEFGSSMPWKAPPALKRWQIGSSSSRRNGIAAERALALNLLETTRRLFSRGNRDKIFAYKIQPNISAA